MNLENMTIEQLKAMAYDTSVMLSRTQYNMQMIVNMIEQKQTEINRSNADNVFKKAKAKLPKIDDTSNDAQEQK